MVEKINAYRPTLLVIKLNKRRPRDLQPTRRWKDNIKTYLKDAQPKCILRHLGDQFRKNDMGGACGTYEGLESCLNGLGGKSERKTTYSNDLLRPRIEKGFFTAVFYDGRNFESCIGLAGENFDTQLKTNFNFFVFSYCPTLSLFHYSVCYSFMRHIAARIVLHNISSMAHNFYRCSKITLYSNIKFFS
jgi:hypothetical protein